MQGRTLLGKVESFVQKMGCWLAPHPYDSLDLAPSDFFLFAHVKNHLASPLISRESFLISRCAHKDATTRNDTTPIGVNLRESNPDYASHATTTKQLSL
jgi:hypothetical protein